VPKRYFDLYPLETVTLPNVKEDDLDDVPPAGRAMAKPTGDHARVLEHGAWRRAVQGYLASISFVDACVGRVVRALDDGPHKDTTVIVLWSDHGWHLGEKEHWGKATGWFESTRIPMIIVPPDNQLPDGYEPGGASTRPVNLLDLAPTLAAMTGVPGLDHWEGNDLAPLVAEPGREWQAHTHTTFGLGNHTVSTERWQYIHYFDDSEELYDLKSDPGEFANLAKDSRYAAIKQKLRSYLPEEPQWKHFVRYHNFKAVIPSDGSPMKLFDNAYRNDVNEQNDIAEDYPEVIEKISSWLEQNPPEGKFLVMAE
jgi:arylsulfatase A-like enzyme